MNKIYSTNLVLSVLMILGLAAAVLATDRLELPAAQCDLTQLVIKGSLERCEPHGKRIQPVLRYRAAPQGVDDVRPALVADHAKNSGLTDDEAPRPRPGDEAPASSPQR